ncbi:unnamed protein product [Adineta ricciae]|uniref:Uncharacterized protein n=1 Tax=Adineta ricciae TaxID=249248 RepID=A0A815BEJ6_ADIRI|nr:unnamed protein product [Adineta ricciae]
MKSVGGSMMDMYPNDYYKEQLQSQFPMYFGSSSRPEEFTLKCGRVTAILLEQMPMLLDEWDPRSKSQINFSTVTLHKDEGRCLSEAMLSAKAVLVYRTNVMTGNGRILQWYSLI